MDENVLEERLNRYSRVTETDGFWKTINDVCDAFELEGSVFRACNTPNAAEYLFAREGMRTFVNKLKGLVNEAELALEQQRNLPKGEEEYE